VVGTVRRVIPPVVDAAWLAQHRNDVVAADVRWYLDGRPGRDAYARGHLPGAVFVDLDAILAGPPTTAGGRHPLPDPEVFARGMAELGVGDRDTVVAYDDDGGVMAARLVWMLRVTGRDAALLDGGLNAWDGPLETEVVDRPTAAFAAIPWPADRIASADDAADRANVVLDARTRERYLGLDDPVDPRWGHVPGARSLPARENLAPDGRFLPAHALRERFEALGVRLGTPVVSYCGSGVTACHTLLAMEHAGVGDGRLFPGSWSQWSADERRPVATGAD
jgi:thiosulfate/3-mercaptopyruvate sulfurtransferase